MQSSGSLFKWWIQSSSKLSTGSYTDPRSQPAERGKKSQPPRVCCRAIGLDNVGGADDPLRLFMPRKKVHETINDIHSQLGHAGQRKTNAVSNCQYHSNGTAIREKMLRPTRSQAGVSCWRFSATVQPSTNTLALRDPQRPTVNVLTVHYNQTKPAPCRALTPGPSPSLVPSDSLPQVVQTVENTTPNPLEQTV
ncbi:unnamed protein product [Schistocephalus solidus]|uniref:Integrase zinc-binding domain-containing protein n=1 Tax=Schistocephalus solidus TaxID=70667 RepID=A0A183TD03_SCHSO|nr:unnamed protein product [Schistocephalus solidus]